MSSSDIQEKPFFADIIINETKRVQIGNLEWYVTVLIVEKYLVALRKALSLFAPDVPL